MVMETSASRSSPRARVVLAWLGAWTLLTLLFAVQDYFFMRTHRPEFGALPAAVWSAGWAACEWYVWIPFTPIVLWCARRWSLIGARRLAHVALLLAVSLPIIALKTSLQALLNWPLLMLLDRHHGGYAETLMDIVLGKTHVQFATFALITGFGHVSLYGEQLQRRIRQEEQLRRSMVEKELEILRYQIQPHFIFNALNSIASVVDIDGPAQQMIVRLGDYLRRLLRRDARPVIALSEEIDALRDYLAIEQVRLGKRLCVAIEMSAECAATQVPALILQPIVENAIRHGAALRPGRSNLQIRVGRDGTCARIVIEDRPHASAHAADAAGASGLGLGLENCRKRLALLYGSDGSLLEEPLAWRGYRVTLAVPLAAKPRLAA
jgi:hypothetical protein